MAYVSKRGKSWRCEVSLQSERDSTTFDAMFVGDIAKRVGIRKDRAERLIQVLKENGVIYCRYIAREQYARNVKNVVEPVDNIQGKAQFDDYRTKSERKS